MNQLKKTTITQRYKKTRQISGFFLFFFSVLFTSSAYPLYNEPDAIYYPVINNAIVFPSEKKEQLIVGILTQNKSIKLENSPWKQTFDRLNRHPDYYFSPLFLGKEELQQSLQDDELDFIICDAINYLVFAEQYGIFRLLTRTWQHSGQLISDEALSVYTLKAQTKLIRLSDLQDKKISLVNNKFSSSALFLKNFLDKHQLYTEKRYSINIDTASNIDTLLELLQNRQIDAIISKSGLLEEYFTKDELSSLRIINPRTAWQASLLHSSELIPEWPFARAWFIDESLASQISALLLTQTINNSLETESYFAKQYTWVINKNYQILHDLPYFSPGIRNNSPNIGQTGYAAQIPFWISLLIISSLIIILIVHMRSARDLTNRLSQSKDTLEQEIKERHQAQQQALSHQAELAHVARLSTMGEMASGLAHELNQPLSAINTYVSGCIRRINMGTDEPEEIINALQLTVQQAERADNIIRRLRSFVRKGESHKTYSDINHLVNEVSSFVQVQLQKSNATLNLNLEQKLPPVLADIIQIEQVLINLLKNALEAMSHNDSPVVQLSTKQLDNTRIELCVIDSGDGISEDKLKRIFNPFFTTKSSGMGMGLSISHSIIEAHDGKLYAANNVTESHSGKRKTITGAKFCFTLPAKEESGSNND